MSMMTSQYLLLIDTSTKVFSVAVSRAGRIIRYRNVQLDKILSSSIIPCMKRILRLADVRFEDIDGFGVGLGPGSFTSLRVGLATIKAFGFATGKPVIGIPSLDVIAMNVAEAAQCPYIATVVDARRGLVYACLYKITPDGMKRQSPYRLTAIDDFLSRLKGETLFTGDGLKLYANPIKEFKRNKDSSRHAYACHFAEERFWAPRAEKMLPLALERLKQGPGDNLNALVPLYLYPENCQVRR